MLLPTRLNVTKVRNVPRDRVMHCAYSGIFSLRHGSVVQWSTVIYNCFSFSLISKIKKKFHPISISFTFYFQVQQMKATLRAPASSNPSNPTTPRMSHSKLASESVRSSNSSLISKPGSSPSTSVADIYQMAANEVRGSTSTSTSSLVEKKKNVKLHQ